MKIYVASSWRNDLQPRVVLALRNAGYEVYDFKNPEPGNHGFHWSEIDKDWKQWSIKTFRGALYHPIAESGFRRDMSALEQCDICVLVLPCGRSAHLEAGYAIGAGKPTFILSFENQEPELMYKMAALICCSINELLGSIKLCDRMGKSPGKNEHQAFVLAESGGTPYGCPVDCPEDCAECPEGGE